MTTFAITGMSCAACAARIEKAVRNVPGTSSCAVSLLTNSMNVQGTAASDAIIQAVVHAGYGAALSADQSPTATPHGLPQQKDTAEKSLILRLCSSMPFLALLMTISMSATMVSAPWSRRLLANPVATALAELLLAATVMVINQNFFISGARAFLHRAPTMDSLVSMGSATSFVWSTVTLFGMTGIDFVTKDVARHALQHLSFAASAMVLVLISIGKLLESRAKGKTTSALADLIKLKPTRINVIRDNAETAVAPDKVRIGDVFVVRPGENIPVDGIVLEGTGAVNEAAITGESLPVDKTAGSTVSAGTLNQSGFLKCQAVHVGNETTLARLIRLVIDASATKAPIARLADRIAGVFVPAVIAIACVTLVVWLLLGADAYTALSHAIAVLVISCPCALGLATPVAIMAGSGVAARHGILFKTAAALESTGRCNRVALDKTGTVTTGKPSVTDVMPSPGVTQQELLSVAYCLESRSDHPLARAIAEFASGKVPLLACTEFAERPGKGLTARLDGHFIRCGNRAFCMHEASHGDFAEKQSEAVTRQGKTPLFFMQDDRLLGIIAVADTIRPEAPQAIGDLQALGIQCVMVTGDNAETAQAIARQCGIAEVRADILPEGKDDAIKELQQQGKVIMVGDGINDAPALARADIGMAIGAGTDIAIDSADVILLKNDIRDIPDAIRLSRATLAVIKQNLFWAFFYNVLGIPLAAGCFETLGWRLSPTFGAAAMSLSSFCVVSNALKLTTFKMRVQDSGDTRDPLTRIMRIKGMMCPHCEATVKAALEAIPGVLSATASHRDHCAVVHLAQPVEDAMLKNAVQTKGYSVKAIK